MLSLVERVLKLVHAGASFAYRVGLAEVQVEELQIAPVCLDDVLPGGLACLDVFHFFPVDRRQCGEEPVLVDLEVVHPQNFQRLATGALELPKLVDPDIAQEIAVPLFVLYHLLQ